MDKSISLDQLRTERARLAEAREELKNNLIAHNGALQAIDQLILLAERPAGNKYPAAAIVKKAEARPVESEEAAD